MDDLDRSCSAPADDKVERPDFEQKISNAKHEIAIPEEHPSSEKIHPPSLRKDGETRSEDVGLHGSFRTDFMTSGTAGEIEATAAFASTGSHEFGSTLVLKEPESVSSLVSSANLEQSINEGPATQSSFSNIPSEQGRYSTSDQFHDSAVATPDQTPVTTLVAPIIQPDSEIDDEAYAESIGTSYVTSIASEISRGILENERVYPNYGQHHYGMPVDEEEMDRMDLQHRKYEMLLGDKHYLAPIGESPQRILDLGTGTGIWALDMADMFPSAEVIGVDIAPIQPKWVAPNCQFEIDDIEADWTWKAQSFDFIHLRDPLLMIRNWPKLMEQVYDHLKPGGWCELASIYPCPTSDDGTMPPNSGFKTYCDRLMEAAALFETPIIPNRYAEHLRNSGFINVRENIFKIPSSPWARNQRMKKIGALELANVIAGATAFGLRAFERVFGWSKLQTEVAAIEFKRDVKNRNYHQYCPYYVVYGQKPPDWSDDHLS